MLAAARTPRRDRIAITSSIVIHAFVLAVVAVSFPRMSFSPDDPDERTLLANLLRIEHRAPHVARTKLTLEAAPQRAEKVPIVHAAVAREHAARQLVVAREERAGPAPAATETPSPKPQRATPSPAEPQSVAGGGAASAGPVQTASPAPSPAPVQRDDGIGNFSESYPAAIDPALRAALFAGMTGVVVRIAVDENGRVTSIEFVRSPSDSTQRDELRSRILATRFTPASCNGLRCAGTLELRN